MAIEYLPFMRRSSSESQYHVSDLETALTFGGLAGYVHRMYRQYEHYLTTGLERDSDRVYHGLLLGIAGEHGGLAVVKKSNTENPYSDFVIELGHSATTHIYAGGLSGGKSPDAVVRFDYTAEEWEQRRAVPLEGDEASVRHRLEGDVMDYTYGFNGVIVGRLESSGLMQYLDAGDPLTF